MKMLYFPERNCAAYATHLLQTRRIELENANMNAAVESPYCTAELRAVRKELQKRGADTTPGRRAAKRIKQAA